jgi:8-oxo-dGTP pyrophosphatase MutT (NUDIX family)
VPAPLAKPTLRDVQRALDRKPPRTLPGMGLLRQAAVAAVVREPAPDAGAELLLIRRADDPRDPWSGHMAFPGGRVERGEAPRAAALRETREEVGLDLERAAAPLGALSPLPTLGRGHPVPMLIFPFVFALAPGDPALQTNHEVASVHWVALRWLLDRSNRSTMDWKIAGGVSITLPCYRWDGNVLWGLTLQMIDDLLERL